MSRNLFGKHLSSQIIWPLVIVSVTVGVLATLFSVRITGDTARTWVDDTAHSTVEFVLTDLNHHARSVTRSLDVLAQRTCLVTAMKEGDREALAVGLDEANTVLEADVLVIRDASGDVVAASGPRKTGIDVRRLPDATEWRSQTDSKMPIIVRLGDSYGLWTVAAVDSPGGEGWSIGCITEIDDALMEQLAIAPDAGALVADDDRRIVAAVRPGAVPGGAPTEEFLRALDEVIADPDSTAIVEGEAGEYHVAAWPVSLADGSGDHLHVVSLVDASGAKAVSAATTRFIAVWSVVAILFLVALNWWVVRSMTTPLHALTTSTRRLAEGDFAAKVEITGSNEVSELAENFNRMTDSLRERSDTLTKKVLELATLYEMSRSLGLTLELDTLLDSVLESALRIFDAEIGYIVTADKETAELHLSAWRGTDPTGPDARIVSNSMSEWVIREGRPLIFNPSGAEADPPAADALSSAIAVLCVPLQTAEGTVGSITVGTGDPERRFTSDDVRLLATIANHVTIAIGNIGLFSSVQEAYLATVRALAAAVDAKDPYTRGHSEGVAEYALQIGSQMELSTEQMTALEMAAYLHDIGKIGISEDILLKPGKLTDAEMGQMRHHPLIGANILKPVAFPWPIAPVVRHHHEHYDGHGYPAGLKTDEIPMLARVLTVADAFEAMVADRPYRRGRSQQEAILELQRCSGTQFDPRVVDAFVSALESHEGISQGSSDREALIGTDEAQAVYIAICDGMFANFRRLGGPRLANNLERAVNDELREAEIPLVLETGRLVMRADAEMDDDEYVAHLRAALTTIRARMEEASGAGLADHFLSEAIQALPERMRAHADRMGFSPTI